MNQDALGAVGPVISGNNSVGNRAVGCGNQRAFFNNGNVGYDCRRIYTFDEDIVNFVNV